MRLDRMFTSHMVFAAGKPIYVWGEGTGCGSIEFDGEVRHFSSVDNRWEVEFPPKTYGGPYELRAEFDGETVVLEDIVIGEVYLLAGQSNLQFKISDGSEAGMQPDLSLDIRLYSPERLEANETLHPEDGWVKNGDRIESWSAIGYLLGNHVAREKNVAIGLISCYQGASCIESWMPVGTLDKLGIHLTREEKFPDHFLGGFNWNEDGVLYERAFGQIVPFRFSAVIWYQGESDTSVAEGKVYADELGAMIDVWRSDLRDEKLPFVIIQIADFDIRTDDGWKMIQQAQLEIQSRRDNVVTVISKDVCESDEIHPRTKSRLAERVAAALRKF